MDHRKIVFKETAIIAIGELIASAMLVAVFVALGKFHWDVVISALAGVAIMTGNYFFMAITVSLAADRAQAGEAHSAQKMVSLSSTVRLIVMGILLFLGIQLGANVIALVMPLAFARPILMVAEFFRKKGD